jgi:hypothetical protein
MGRQHVVVGINNSNVGAPCRNHPKFVYARSAGFVRIGHGRKGMRYVGTPHAVRTGLALRRKLYLLQIRLARGCAAGLDATGNGIYRWMEGNWRGYRGHNAPKEVVTKLRNTS